MKRNGAKPTKDGELMTCDYIILKNAISEGSKGERVLLNCLDVGTDWLTPVPDIRRTGRACFNGILQHTGKIKVKQAHIDDAKELKKACKDHGIPAVTSAPNIHVTNGYIEVHNRIEIFGCKVDLEQCGAPLMFWPDAFKHFAYSRNMFPIADRPSPYERRFNQGPFPGLRVPFFARVRFKQLPTIEKSAKTHRVGPSRVWGVFIGWSVEPGGK